MKSTCCGIGVEAPPGLQRMTCVPQAMDVEYIDKKIPKGWDNYRKII